jgi:hypothetical protein
MKGPLPSVDMRLQVECYKMEARGDSSHHVGGF